MKRNLITEKVEKIASTIAAAHGAEVVEIELVGEPKGLVLRVYIDRDGGVDLELCQAVSEELSVNLDVEDPIAQHYFLEVSSPGIERPLRKPADFQKFKGREIKAKTYEPVEGRKNFKGINLGLSGEGFGIDCEGKVYAIGFENLAKARLIVEVRF